MTGTRPHRPSAARSVLALALLGACAPHALRPPSLPAGTSIGVASRSAAPAAPFVDPSGEGLFGVAQVPLPQGLGELWLPIRRESTGPAVAFPLPLVVFAAGFAAHPRDYEASLRALASHGFAVLAADHGLGFVSALLCRSQAAGKRRVERALEVVRGWSRAAGDLQGFWSGEDFATLGHSYGGKVALWLAHTTPGVAAAVAWDPVDGGGERSPPYCLHSPDAFPHLRDLVAREAPVPTLLFGAGQGGACSPAGENAEAILPDLPGATLLWMPGAGHADFVDAAATPDCVACGFCPPSREDAATLQRFVRASTVAFLKSAWLGDTRYAPFVRGAPPEGFAPVSVPALEWRESPGPGARP